MNKNNFFLTLVTWMAFQSAMFAQTIISPVYNLPSYTLLKQMNWRDSVYRFRKFQPGKIILGNGNPGPELLLNYNIYYNELELIAANGDTIHFKIDPAFRSVYIGDHFFINDRAKRFLEIQGDGPVTLGIETRFRAVMESSSGQKLIMTDLRETTSRYDRLYTKNQLYYFLDREKNIVHAVHSNLKELFPDNLIEINEYIEHEKINFKSRQSLLKLLRFANAASASPDPALSFFRLRSDKPVSMCEWKDSVYSFPNFIPGRIRYDGQPATVVRSANYNQFTGNLEYISPDHDTIPEHNPQNIKALFIDGRSLTFHPAFGYLEIVVQGPLSVGVSKRMTLLKKQVESDDVLTGASILKTDRHEYLYYRRDIKYYFIDRHYHFLPADQQTLLKLYRGQEKKITDFIQSQKINFKNGSDLKKLVQFINASSISL